MKSYLGIIRGYFKLNIRRTVFTIIGIILSITLLTAVSILVDGNSAGNRERVLSESGYYHADIHNLNSGQKESLKQASSVEKIGNECKAGTFLVEDQGIYINGEVLDKSAMEMFKVKVYKGRLPESKNEIAIDRKSAARMKTSLSIGDKLVLVKTTRTLTIVGNSGKASVQPAHDVTDITKSEFIISGFYDCSFYPFQYSAMLHAEYSTAKSSSEHNYITYVKFKNGIHVKNEIESLSAKGVIGQENYVGYNEELLIAIGQMIDWNSLLFKFILSLIIALATIAAIYNVFYISVIERVKHYGILRSVGSSPRQTRALVISEALLMCLIALPAGLLMGLLLAGVIFYLTPDIISSSAKFVVLPRSLIVPALLGLATVVFSTIKPALTAGKITPIEAISNTGYRLENEKIKVRTWQKLIYRILKISGLMAYRNLWRYKKKFLVTVFSMCLCTILFIVFTYVLSTLFRIGENSYNVPMAFSIKAGYGEDDNPGISEKDFNKIIGLKGVERVERVHFLNFAFLERDGDLEDGEAETKQTLSGKNNRINCRIMGVESSVLENARLKSGKIQTVIESEQRRQLDKAGEYAVLVENNYPANKKRTGVEKQFKVGEKITLYIWSAKKRTISSYNARVAGILDNSDSYWRSSGDNNVRLILDNYSFKRLSGIKDYQRLDIYAQKSADKADINTELERISEAVPESNVIYYEEVHRESIQQGENIKVFYLGYIAILSLIGIFNIFNAISAGIILRTRELSTLKAIGMTNRQLQVNIMLEGMFHGIISSVWGAVIGAAVSYVFYNLISRDAGYISWQIPWISIFIAAGINLAVCLVATAAPFRRISKINIIEGIRVVD